MADWVSEVIRARWLVASLGESVAPPWWRSQATSAAGLSFLRRLFPRTYLQASLEAASRAAAIEHDGRIGRFGVYHLFRLPTAGEALIHNALRQPATDLLLQSLAEMTAIDNRLDELEKLGAPEDAFGGPGPVSCGSVDDLRRGMAVPRICSAYAAGLRGSAPVYPYLEERPT